MAWLDVNPNSDFPPILHFFSPFSASFHRKIVTKIQIKIVFSSAFSKKNSEYLPNDLDASESNPNIWRMFFQNWLKFWRKTKTNPKSWQKTKNVRKLYEKRKKKSEKLTNYELIFIFHWRKSTKSLPKTVQISAKKVPKSGGIGIRIHV